MTKYVNVNLSKHEQNETKQNSKQKSKTTIKRYNLRKRGSRKCLNSTKFPYVCEGREAQKK